MNAIDILQLEGSVPWQVLQCFGFVVHHLVLVAHLAAQSYKSCLEEYDALAQSKARPPREILVDADSVLVFTLFLHMPRFEQKESEDSHQKETSEHQARSMSMLACVTMDLENNNCTVQLGMHRNL